MKFNIESPFTKIRARLANKSPYEKWRLSKYIVKCFFKGACCPVVNDNLTFRWYNWLGVLNYVFFYFVIYCTFYLYRNDVLMLARNMYLYCAVIPMSIQYYIVTGPLLYQYRSLIFFAGNSIFKNCTNERLLKILDKSATRQLIIVAILSGLLFSGVFAFFALPFYVLIVYREKILFLSIVLPFTDVDSDWGYWMNFLNTSILTNVSACLNIAADSSFTLIINNMWAGVDVVQFSMDEMLTLFQRTGDRMQQAAQFRNILIQIQDLDKFIVSTKRVFYLKLLWQPIFYTVSLLIVALILMTTNSPSEYGFGGFIYCQLILMCYLGNEVKVINEALKRSVCDMPWYLLPKTQQLNIVHVLHRLQNGCTLTIGPFAELNFETATAITKSMYSYLMLLFNAVKG